ncbi:NAD(P)-binding domain-containing protein [Variovorax defluvii]|uniref:NAD(P)-binding domain-containing protein n=1 Tax=Variovorax defluvii TaxID=913761 RepID=A0ABP8HAR3_9BURK
MTRVAIVGAGPGGLVAARYLRSEGLTPVVFDKSPLCGGQWTGLSGSSGVWPSMRTNTSRVLTQFSDLPHRPDVALYPSADQIRAYLLRYRQDFLPGLPMHTDATVHEIEAVPGGWAVRHDRGEEVFEKVVIATGRFQHPEVPDVPGLKTFSGRMGIAHSSAYRGTRRHRNGHFLVAGCAISALEVASELCMSGARRVVVCYRRQRYVLPKLKAGVPTDHLLFTREQAEAEDALPRGEFGARLKALVLASGGSPEQYGLPRPADDIFEAGLTLSQHYLPLVAEGRIQVRPWIDRIEGTEVRFRDGRAECFDGIYFGTGFALHLPFLAPSVRATLNLGPQRIDLFRHTFHPQLPGLAFMGLWDQSGPYFPPLELQARWIAYTWSGAIAPPTADEMEEGLAACRARGDAPPKTRMNLVALDFARAAGVEPDPKRWPGLARALWSGPLAPVSFRLEGRDALPDAAARFAAEVPELVEH